MNKMEFHIERINHETAGKLINKYHYLSTISRGFKSGFNYGLFCGDDLAGVIIFTGLPVPEIAKGAFGLARDDQEGLFELSRLCLNPKYQNEEYHNLASWFMARGIKRFREDTKVRAILSYADSTYHSGIVYAATNWDYYGLTTEKKDFWYKLEGGSLKKHSRGKTKGVEGVWLPRSQKHRFLKVFDKKLTVLWEKQKWNNKKEVKDE